MMKQNGVKLSVLHQFLEFDHIFKPSKMYRKNSKKFDDNLRNEYNDHNKE